MPEADNTFPTGPPEETFNGERINDLTEEELAEVMGLRDKILESEGSPGFFLPDGRSLTSHDLRQMSKYFSDLMQTMIPVFVAFQDQFKKASLALATLSEFMEAAAKKEMDKERQEKKTERRTRIENDDDDVKNVFSNDKTVDL